MAGRAALLLVVSLGAVTLIVYGAYGARQAGGDPIAGKRVFVKHCARCHAMKAAGSKTAATRGPELDEVRPTYRQVFNCVTYGTGIMPAFGTKRLLTRQQIRDLATFVSRATRPNKPPTPILRCGPLPPPP